MSISVGNSKVGSIPNVSLPPIKSCGNCEYCAASCYAKKSYRMYADTRASWDHNFETAKNDPAAYFKMIETYLGKKRKKPLEFFRWHVSGDILSQDYLNNMIRIAKRFPQIKFLAFTKMFSLTYRGLPSNLQIVFSIFPGMPLPKRKKGIRFAWMQDGTENRIPQKAIFCPGFCESCGLCWNLSAISADVFFKKH